MPTYTVREAEKVADRPDKGYGPMQSIRLVLQEYGQAETTGAEWYTKAATALPTVGSMIEGDIKPGQYGPQFKRAQQAGGGGRGGGRSPEESRRIVRQHSQHMALKYAAMRLEDGDLPPHFGFEQLKAAIDWFHKDAMEGGQ